LFLLLVDYLFYWKDLYAIGLIDVLFVYEQDMQLQIELAVKEAELAVKEAEERVQQANEVFF